MRSGKGTLAKWLSRRDMTLEELVETADSMVRELAPKQTRYKVTERPDARTIRYYVTLGLLPKPVGYEGGRARYAGSHLLRLLLVKRMQAEHYTLARIARILERADDAAVLKLLDVPGDPATVNPVETPPMPAAAPAGPARARRIELAPGGALELPPDVLGDATARRKLAESLETLAAWLRQTTADEEEGEQG